MGSILSVSGVDGRWGLVSLAAGLVAVLIAIQVGTGRLIRRSPDTALAVTGVVVGLVSVAGALYVGFAIRDTVAEQETRSSSASEADTGSDELDASRNEFQTSLEELFKVGTGVGVYVTTLGGLLVAAGGAMTFRRRDAPCCRPAPR